MEVVHSFQGLRARGLERIEAAWKGDVIERVGDDFSDLLSKDLIGSDMGAWLGKGVSGSCLDRELNRGLAWR